MHSIHLEWKSMEGRSIHLAICGEGKTDVYVLNVCDTRLQFVSQWVKQAGRTPLALLLELRLLRRLLLPGWGPQGPGHRHVDSCSLPIALISIPPHLSLSLSDLSRAFPFRHAWAIHTGSKEEEEKKRRRKIQGGWGKEGAKCERDPAVDYTAVLGQTL